LSASIARTASPPAPRRGTVPGHRSQRSSASVARLPRTSRATGERRTHMPASTRPNRSLKREPTQKSAGGFRLKGRTVRTVRASRHHPATHRLKISVGCQGQRGAATKAVATTPAAATAPPFEDQAHPEPAHRGRATSPTSGAAERFARPETLTGRASCPFSPITTAMGMPAGGRNCPPTAPAVKEVSGSAFETGF
jgi:hypothetical protein